MNWKEKGFLLLVGGLAGMFLASEVFDDDSDERSEKVWFGEDDEDFAEE